MDCKYVKKLEAPTLINEFEELVKYKYSESFKNFVLKNNGGRPARRTFDTNKKKERELKSFLSFNKKDRETVWKIFEWNQHDLNKKLAPFAIDNFGNLICFKIESDEVVFLNHDNLDLEKIAHSFDEFLEMLYE